MIEIPYIFTIAVKIFGKRWFHFEPTHYYYFSKRTLAALLGKTGFEVAEMCFFPKFVTPALVVQVFGKHMTFVRVLTDKVHRLLAACRLDQKYLKIKSRDFLGAVAEKCS